MKGVFMRRRRRRRKVFKGKIEEKLKRIEECSVLWMVKIVRMIYREKRIDCSPVDRFSSRLILFFFSAIWDFICDYYYSPVTSRLLASHVIALISSVQSNRIKSRPAPSKRLTISLVLKFVLITIKHDNHHRSWHDQMKLRMTMSIIFF